MNSLINLGSIFFGIGASLAAIIITRLIGQSLRNQIIAAISSFIIAFIIAYWIPRLVTKPPVPVPSVEGTFIAVGERSIKEAGLKPQVHDGYDPSIDPYRIIRQDPKGGTLVRKGSVVTIVVNKKPELPIEHPKPEEPPVPIEEEGVNILMTKFKSERYIKGKVSGLKEAEHGRYKLLVYVLTDKWYIHPWAENKEGRGYALIESDGFMDYPNNMERISILQNCFFDC